MKTKLKLVSSLAFLSLSFTACSTNKAAIPKIENKIVLANKGNINFDA